MQVVVGRIGRAHGIGGEVSVEVRTDSPETRFAPSAVLATDPPERGPLTVRRARWHSGRLLVDFDEVSDRSAAEALRGTLLVADSATSPPAGEDEYWDHELVDLPVETTAGLAVGAVAEVLHLPGNDVLVVRREDGGEVLVPFVRAIVPVVDVRGRRVVVDPPDGLFEL